MMRSPSNFAQMHHILYSYYHYKHQSIVTAFFLLPLQPLPSSSSAARSTTDSKAEADSTSKGYASFGTGAVKPDVQSGLLHKDDGWLMCTMHTHTHMHTKTCIHACTQARMHTHTHACTHIRTHAHTPVLV